MTRTPGFVRTLLAAFALAVLALPAHADVGAPAAALAAPATAAVPDLARGLAVPPAPTAAPASGAQASGSGPCRPGLPGVVLQGALVRWTVSPCMGGLESIRLLDPQFAVPAREPPHGVAPWAKGRFAAGPLELVDTWDARWDPFRDQIEDVTSGPVTLVQRRGNTKETVAAVDLAAWHRRDPAWGVVKQSATEAVLVWPDPARVQSPVYLQKRVRLAGADKPYLLQVDLALWNLGAAPLQAKVAHEITTFQQPGGNDGGFLAVFSGMPDHKEAGFSLAEETARWDVYALAEAEAAERNRVGLPEWLGVGSRYFLLAAAPVAGFGATDAAAPAGTGQAPTVSATALANGVVVARLKAPGAVLGGAIGACVPSWYAATWGGASCRADLDALGLHLDEAAPAATLQAALATATGDAAARARLGARRLQAFAYEIYAGPKEVDALKPAGHNLVSSVDFGWFGLIAMPMLAVLKFAQGLTGSWPVAIVLLTVLVKILLWPATGKSMKSMRNMQKIKPELDRVRKDLEDKAKKQGLDKPDPQELNRVTFELYKKHGVNPLGGCLPLLLQMPIYIALYRTINSSVELFNQPLFGWVTDLTQKDPYYVLPVLLGGVMFLQQKLTPQTAGDPMQQKMMLYFMPILFTAMMLQLPSGLTLYILANTVLGILQTMVYNREAVAAPATSSPTR